MITVIRSNTARTTKIAKSLNFVGLKRRVISWELMIDFRHFLQHQVRILDRIVQESRLFLLIILQWVRRLQTYLRLTLLCELYLRISPKHLESSFSDIVSLLRCISISWCGADLLDAINSCKKRCSPGNNGCR